MIYFSLKESVVIVSFVILSVLGVSYAAPTQTAPGGQPPELIRTGPGSTVAQSKLGEAPGNITSADVVRRALAVGVNSEPFYNGVQTFMAPPWLGQTVHVNGITIAGSLSLPANGKSDGLLIDGITFISGTTTVSKTTNVSTDGDVTVTDFAGSGNRNVCIVRNSTMFNFTINSLTICP